MNSINKVLWHNRRICKIVVFFMTLVVATTTIITYLFYEEFVATGTMKFNCTISVTGKMEQQKIKKCIDLIKQEKSKPIRGISYISSVNDFTIIAYDYKAPDEMYSCKLNINQSEKAIVSALREEEFQQMFPQMQYELEKNILQYGLEKGDASCAFPLEVYWKQFNGCDELCLEFEERLNYFEYRRISKIIKKILDNVVISRNKILNKAIISHYKSTIERCIFTIGYALGTMLLLYYYLLKKEKKEIQVYLMCGARKKWVLSYLLRQIFALNVLALILGIGIGCLIINQLNLLKGHKLSIEPTIFVCVVFSLVSVIVGAYGMSMSTREEKKE